LIINRIEAAFPKENLYKEYSDGFDNNTLNQLANDPQIVKDVEKFMDKNGDVKEAIGRKLDSVETGVRLVRIKNIMLGKNKAMGIDVKDETIKINLTIIGTYSKLVITPLPIIGSQQFSDYKWSNMKIQLQLNSLNKNEEVGTKDWMTALFKK